MFEDVTFAMIVNYGLPTFLLLIFVYKISPAMEQLSVSINGLKEEIRTLKEVQVSLRDTILTHKR